MEFYSYNYYLTFGFALNTVSAHAHSKFYLKTWL